MYKCCFLACFCASQRVQRRKAELTLVQIREKATKRLVRLTPNVANMCKFILEWIYAKQIAPRYTRGHLGGLGGQQFKSLGKLSDWHQLWFTSADSSKYKSPLNTPGGIWGELGCHKFKSLGKLSNGWTDWHNILHTHLQIHLGIDLRQTNCPSRHKWGTWGVLGVKHSNVWGSCQTAGPNGTGGM